MSRELNKIFDVKSRQARRDILDKFDLSKEDKNKVLNKIDSGGGTSGDSGENNTQIIGMLPEVIKPRFVDLGLPSGTLWADANLGSSHPFVYGLYYSWGELNGFQLPMSNTFNKNFNVGDYKFFDPNDNNQEYIKYNNTDNLMQLLDEDNPVKLFDKDADIPTIQQAEELLQYTTCDALDNIYIGGRYVSYFRLTSTINNNSIVFYDEVGMIIDGELRTGNHYSNPCWLKDISPIEEDNLKKYNASVLNVSGGSYKMSINKQDRAYGCQIRPVKINK